MDGLSSAGTATSLPQPLPAEHYIEPGWFETDKQAVFARSWQCVCHVSELAHRGAYATLTIAAEPVVVVRDDDDALRAYSNVCRHRGHPLVEGSGRVGKRLVCPYHGWAYNRDGALVRVPGQDDTDPALCDQIRLTEHRVEQFCGFVFVNLDSNATSLRDQVGEFEPIFESYHPDPDKLVFVCETAIEHESNWKISVENYNECYHCPTVHATSLTRGVLSLDGYSTVPRGQMIWHEGKAQTEKERQYDYNLDASPRAGDYGAYWLWPNVSFCFYPGGYFTIRQWLPISYRKTIYRYRWFSDGAIPDEDVRSLMEKHKRTTGAEDEAVVSRVQTGMESPHFEPGPYVIGDGQSASSEVGLQHFHALYRAAITNHVGAPGTRDR